MKSFEQEIIQEIVKQSSIDVSIFSGNDFEEEIYYADVSYRLTLKNIGTEKKCEFLDQPEIFGKLDGIDVGFSIIIQANNLTLECYSNNTKITEENRNGSFERTNT